MAGDRKPTLLQIQKVIPIHQFGRLGRQFVPIRDVTDLAGDHEDGRPEIKGFEDRCSIENKIRIAVVEGDDNRPSGNLDAAVHAIRPLVERDGMIAIPAKIAHMRLERRGRDSIGSKLSGPIIGDAVVQ
jgi:hypothetical protein